MGGGQRVFLELNCVQCSSMASMSATTPRPHITALYQKENMVSSPLLPSI